MESIAMLMEFSTKSTEIMWPLMVISTESMAILTEWSTTTTMSTERETSQTEMAIRSLAMATSFKGMATLLLAVDQIVLLTGLLIWKNCRLVQISHLIISSINQKLISLLVQINRLTIKLFLKVTSLVQIFLLALIFLLIHKKMFKITDPYIILWTNIRVVLIQLSLQNQFEQIIILLLIRWVT